VNCAELLSRRLVARNQASTILHRQPGKSLLIKFTGLPVAGYRTAGRCASVTRPTADGTPCNDFLDDVVAVESRCADIRRYASPALHCWRGSAGPARALVTRAEELGCRLARGFVLGSFVTEHDLLVALAVDAAPCMRGIGFQCETGASGLDQDLRR